MGPCQDEKDSESDSRFSSEDCDGESSASDPRSSRGSSSSSGSDSSSSSASASDDDSDVSRSDENFEIGFWQSLRAVLPWTEEGKEADYAEERLDARDEFQEELDQALLLRKMVEMGLHDRALERLMAVTEGQMYHHFHKHRYQLEKTGEWLFFPPSIRRKWRLAANQTENVAKLRAYMAVRRDRFLRIRALCSQVRNSGLKIRDMVVTIMPNDLVDRDLLSIAEKGKQKKDTSVNRLKKCRWQGIGTKGEACTCTNYRMEHPHRLFRDDVGALVHDTLTTCGWHATHCVSDIHGDDPIPVSTANERALCNECLAQITKGPLRYTTAFGAPGVRMKNKQAGGSVDADTGSEILAWNKWFTKGPGRFRKNALRPRHPHAPPGYPPVGLHSAAVYVPPPPPPPVFSMANFRRQQQLAKWRLRKENTGGNAATVLQGLYRGFRARRQKAMAALEHPARALHRVESAIVMQSLVRRFLARSFVLQIFAFRHDSAKAIQRIVRGMLMKTAYRRKLAERVVSRQMTFYIARSYMASARVARRVREEMRQKNAVALSLQCIWRGKKGRERIANLRAVRVRRLGAAITIQKAYRSYLARRELQRRREAFIKRVEASIIIQSGFRMAITRSHMKEKWAKLTGVALTLQPLVRGFLARKIALQERAIVDQAWSWLGTNSETANSIYARFLPKNSYIVSRGGGEDVLPLVGSLTGKVGVGLREDENGLITTGVSAISSRGLMSATFTRLKTVPGEEHFTERFDKDRTGTCTKVEFKIGLKSFCRSVGYPLQREEAAAIFKRYYDGDGFCGWHSFLQMYHDENGGNDACARHGNLLCAVCVRRGECQKPGCFCGKAKAGRSKQLGFKMCECGHPFDIHRLLVGAAAPTGRALRRGKVIREKKGCTVASTSVVLKREVENQIYARPGAHKVHACHNRQRKTRTQRQKAQHLRSPQGRPAFDSFRESLCLPSSTDHPPSSPSSVGHNSSKDSPTASPSRGNRVTYAPILGPEDSHELPLSPVGGQTTMTMPLNHLPTLQEAKRKEELVRDMSWAGRRGQAARAALAEMNSVSQGKNAAEYAVKLKADLAANEARFDGQSSLAAVQTKKEFQRGFLISEAVSFVKGGVLKATMNAVGMYLYLLRALSDEQHELLEDNQIFTAFVARHVVFFERHWFKLIKDIRNGHVDPHLPISDERRARVQTLMIPNKKRAQRLDDALRVLGFHARASGNFSTFNTTSNNLSEVDQEESMAKRMNASRKRPCAVNVNGVTVAGGRRHRRTVGGGEMESEARQARSRLRGRPRSPSVGAVHKIPTAEEASEVAYKLITKASIAPAGVVQASSGRRIRKHVCTHPGCGKVFHLRMSAAAHQKEHQFQRGLATKTPLIDQFLSTVWPSHGVLWSAKSTAAPGQHKSKTVNHDEAFIHARFTCRVPKCGRRFESSKLLGLHLRVGHCAFDLEKMKQSEWWASKGGGGGVGTMEGSSLAVTLDGLSITNWIDVGGGLGARFVGRYRLVPPFMPPSGCPIIEACAQHCWLKKGCRRCQEVEERAKPALPGLAMAEQGSTVQEETAVKEVAGVAKSAFGFPVPPAKFYARARVKVSHHGRPVELDLDSAEVLRCAILVMPLASTPIPVSSNFTATKANKQSDRIETREVQQGKREEASFAADFSSKFAEGGITRGEHICGDPFVNFDVTLEHVSRVGGGRGGSGTTRSQEFSSSVEGDESALVTSQGGNGVIQRHEVPVQIVAVLVDGAGKGWLAARRLWSPKEVGMEPLVLAGLTLQDLDLNQEFLLGTSVEYLPMLLVNDTCAVVVARRGDLQAKQRRGDLPMSVRYVSHGFDSRTGTVLRDSELKLREQQLLGTGAGGKKPA